MRFEKITRAEAYAKVSHFERLKGSWSEGFMFPENTASWPEGDYCIMPGKSRKYNDGTHEEPYIRLGNAGGFNLLLKEYDQAYALRLTACCKY
ncbi:hypothetical protein ANCCEY_10415 [Ancylostoma ceylanicum]|uniref:Uncharacterized protein n=1 Tax=Ancylostoma ceylanicum TaxID=53326 RepID=A0A0D6LS63_9BILA|nr:hypothetical protein ANCCEY_10415 [Ancylostoma ceylanicum]